MNQKDQKHKFTFKARANSFKYAHKGLWFLFRNEHNAWVHIFFAAIVLIAGLYLNINTVEWCLVVFAIGFVLAAEAFNTAIETVVDLVSPDFHPKAGMAKDLAAASVLIAAITAAAIGLIIFIPKIWHLFQLNIYL